MQRVFDALHVRTVEAESVDLHQFMLCAHLVVVNVKDGVRQSSRSPHHRNRAVSHGDELRQAARLEHGRHQQHVGTRVDEVAQRLVVAENHAYRVVVELLQLVAELIPVLLHVRVEGRPEKRHVTSSPERNTDGMLHQIRSLLLCEAAHDTDNRLIRHAHAEMGAQLFLRPSLALDDILRAVWEAQELVVQRIPNVRVNAVANSVEFPMRWIDARMIPHLARVRRAHRRSLIRVRHRLLNFLLAEVEVVDREYHARVVEPVRLVILPEALRRGSRRPVVAVDNVRIALRLQHPLERSLGEEAEALAVSHGHRLPVGTVNHSAVEEAVLRPDEVHVEILNLAVVNLVIRAAPRKALQLNHIFNEAVLHDVVLGHNHLHAVPEILHRTSQAGHDIAEAANFADWRHLHSHVNDVHWGLLVVRIRNVDVVVERVAVVNAFGF
mmetsp:Transcript_8253/g.18733  ORF Transcript_8253/g.18733 Transcript_8253/m.18733 type:complete len:439 (-) Transcript_8253:873-2189(-)